MGNFVEVEVREADKELKIDDDGFEVENLESDVEVEVREVVKELNADNDFDIENPGLDVESKSE
jgi:hypothetical protein